MKTIDTLPASEQADKEEVLRLLAEGKRVTDPELRRRIHERAERVREQVRATTRAPRRRRGRDPRRP